MVQGVVEIGTQHFQKGVPVNQRKQRRERCYAPESLNSRCEYRTFPNVKRKYSYCMWDGKCNFKVRE